MDIGLKPGTVRLDEYTSEWTELYKLELEVLMSILIEYDVRIYHIGSTSIPSVESKPIIDILIVIPDINYNDIVLKLIEHKYHKCSYQPRGEILFKKGNDEISTHYYHLVTQSKDWQRYLLFKDYLITHPCELINYQNLKKELVNKYSDDRRQYTSQKASFVERILKEAIRFKNKRT